MKSRDHKAAINAYLTEMKGIQETATANFTAAESNGVTMRAQAKVDKAAGISAKNNAYWASEEGQRVLAKSREPEVTLVNDTPSVLLINYGSGISDELEPGEKKTFSCSGGNVHRGTRRANNTNQWDDSDNVLLKGNGKNCGAVINASTGVSY